MERIYPKVGVRVGLTGRLEGSFDRGGRWEVPLGNRRIYSMTRCSSCAREIALVRLSTSSLRKRL